MKVSQVINVQMSMTLLEKRTKTYDSPFYQITQTMEGTKARVPETPSSTVGTVTPAQVAATPAQVAATPATAPTPAAAVPAPSPSSRTDGRRARTTSQRTQSSQGNRTATTQPTPTIAPPAGATPFDVAFPQFARKYNYNSLLTPADVNLNLAMQRNQPTIRSR
jgi:hypothetical protein